MIRRDGNDCSMNSTTDNNTLFFTPIIIIIIIMMMMTQKSAPPPVIQRSLHPRCCSLETGGQPVVLILTLVPEYSKYSCRWSGLWLIDWFVVDADTSATFVRSGRRSKTFKLIKEYLTSARLHVHEAVMKNYPRKKKKRDQNYNSCRLISCRLTNWIIL